MPTDTLYEQDFYTWALRQAEALRTAARAGSNLPIDWENLAEEVEDMGSEVRHKIEGLTHQILVHLLKLGCSSADQPRAKWKTEVDEWRRQLKRRLDENHALRARYEELVEAEWKDAVRSARLSFIRFEEQDALPKLEAWRARGITAAEVRTDGLFASPNGVEMLKEPE